MKKDGEEVDISISTGTMIRVILVMAFFAVMWFLRDIFLVVLTAIVLASAIEPAVRFFAKHGVPRLLGLVMVYGIGALMLGGIFYFFVPALLDDVSVLADVVPKYVDVSSLWSPLSARVRLRAV